MRHCKIVAVFILAAAIATALSGCGSKHMVSSLIMHGKAPVMIDGKSYAYGDAIAMMDKGGSDVTEAFCGEVIDMSGELFPEHHFAIAAGGSPPLSNPDRDCGPAVKFFRDFLVPGNSFTAGGFWRGLEVDYECARQSSHSPCTAHEGNTYPGGFSAKKMPQEVSSYTDNPGFFAIAVAF